MSRIPLTFFIFLFCIAPATASAQPTDVKIPILIRCDDIGMSHSVNMAARRVLDKGFPVSMSVMFACPWYAEAVEILKPYSNAAVGVHLTLNAEWKQYRWGPVSGRSSVPSLVDSSGMFFPSRSLLFRAHLKNGFLTV